MTFPPVRFALATASLALGPSVLVAQTPFPPNKGQDQGPARPDEFKAMVKEVQEAYKAPFEVDKDIRDELKKQYQNPTADREAKILREVRRLYVTTPEQEARIVLEMRRAYELPSADQEERIFAEVRRMGKLPPGTVPLSLQSTQAERLFQKLDANRDGVLSGDELPANLAANLAKWDTNRDGAIDAKEYGAYYQASLKTVSEKVASGEIAIKLPNGALPPKPLPPEEQPLQVFRAGKLPQGLPEWFAQLDTDMDGQVGLYEWRAAGRNVEEFKAMDLNGDGLLTAEECLKWLKMTAAGRTKAEVSVKSAPRVGNPMQKPGRGAEKPGTGNVPPGIVGKSPTGVEKPKLN